MEKWGNISKGWKLLVLMLVICSKNIFISEVYATEIDEDKNILEEDKILIESVTTYEDVESIIDNTIDEEVIGENTDLEIDVEISKETIFNNYSDNLEFIDDKVIIKGNIQEETKVLDVLNNIDIFSLSNDYEVEKIVFINESNSLLNNDDIVTNLCTMMIMGKEFINQYKVEFLGDFDQDNVITENDVIVGVDQFIENNNEEIKTEEISYVDAVVKENTYEVEVPVDEVLDNKLEVSEEKEYYVGDKITVQYGISGFINNYMNTLSGNLEYNHEMLELDNVYVLVDGVVVGKIENDKFIYVFDKYQSNNVLMMIVFDSLKSGETSVKLTNLKVAMNGTLLNLENDATISILFNEYGIGGNPEDSFNNNFSIIETPSIIEPVITKNENNNILTPTINSINQTPSITQTIVVLSNDNYIKKMNIKGYSIDFDKDITYYSIEVDNDVKSLDFSVLLNDANASYYVSGNENFKKGKNDVILTVYAEDGSSKDYVIEVNKKGKQTVINRLNIDIKGLKKTILFITLIVLILAIIRIIYMLLKKEN